MLAIVCLLAAVAGALAVASTGSAATTGWTGTFDGFPAQSWADRWGLAAQGFWGFDNDLAAVNDPTSPGGAALAVTYRAGSSAHSCTNCPAAGGGGPYVS